MHQSALFAMYADRCRLLSIYNTNLW